MIKVFVYGTLKPGEANYNSYCEGKVIAATKAYTFGQLYALPMGYPGMTEGNGKVEGFLLTFDNPKILASLDRLEDYEETRSPQINEYYRQQVAIYDLSGGFLDYAWAYFMTKAKVIHFQGILLSSGWWTGKR